MPCSVLCSCPGSSNVTVGDHRSIMTPGPPKPWPRFFLSHCVCVYCVCACTCQCTLEEVRRSEDRLWEWTLSFHGDPRDQTQVTRLGISLPNMVLGSLVSESQREPLLSWRMLALAAGPAHAQHSHMGATAAARHRNCSSSLLHPTRVLSPGHSSPEAYSVPTLSPEALCPPTPNSSSGRRVHRGSTP